MKRLTKQPSFLSIPTASKLKNPAYHFPQDFFSTRAMRNSETTLADVFRLAVFLNHHGDVKKKLNVKMFLPDYLHLNRSNFVIGVTVITLF